MCAGCLKTVYQSTEAVRPQKQQNRTSVSARNLEPHRTGCCTFMVVYYVNHLLCDRFHSDLILLICFYGYFPQLSFFTTTASTETYSRSDALIETPFSSTGSTPILLCGTTTTTVFCTSTASCFTVTMSTPTFCLELQASTPRCQGQSRTGSSPISAKQCPRSVFPNIST